MPVEDRNVVRSVAPSTFDALRTLDGVPDHDGMITWKPRAPEPRLPSAWMETTASASFWLPIRARTLTHGPTPVSSGRVSTTVAPRARRIDAARLATSQV